jgi:hypothetical protein
MSRWQLQEYLSCVLLPRGATNSGSLHCLRDSNSLYSNLVGRFLRKVPSSAKPPILTYLPPPLDSYST